jgi:hypothetical protein
MPFVVFVQRSQLYFGNSRAMCRPWIICSLLIMTLFAQARCTDSQTNDVAASFPEPEPDASWATLIASQEAGFSTHFQDRDFRAGPSFQEHMEF